MLHIETPPLFSFSECLRFLDRGYDECLHHVDGNRVIKPVMAGCSKFLIQIHETDGFLQADILASDPSPEIEREAAVFVHDWFDLDRDLYPFYEKLKRDGKLSYMPERYAGLRLMGIPNLFEALCWCVIGQQINLSFAHRLKRNLVENYGTSLQYQSKTHHFFPEPEILAALNTDDLKRLQFSRQKAEYIIGIAQEFCDGAITKEELGKYPDTASMLDRLTEIRGVGVWTANYVLMKTMKRMDCITFGDSGLNSAVAGYLGLDRKPAKKQVEKVFKPYSGWESYLNIYLWRSLGEK